MAETETTPSFEVDSVIFLEFLVKALQQVQMYSSSHPATQEFLDRAFNLLSVLLRKKRALLVSHVNGKVRVQEKPLPRRFPAAPKLIEAMEDRNVGGFACFRGIDRAELVSLLEILSMNRDKVFDVDGGVRTELLEQMPNVKVNDMLHAAFTEDEVIDAEDDAVALEKMIDREISNLTSRNRRPATFSEALERVYENMDLSDEIKNDTDGSKAREFFDSASRRLVEQFHAGVDDIQKNLGESVAHMPPAMQMSLFGKIVTNPDEIDVEPLIKGFSTDVKAALVANEIEAGGDDDDVLAKINSILSPGEIVQLAEAFSQKIQVKGQGPAGRQMVSNLFQIIQGGRGEEVKRDLGLVVIADADPSMAMNYKSILEHVGFQTMHFSNGQMALDAVHQLEPVLLITDIKLEGLTGIRLVSELQREHSGVPILVVTALKYFRDMDEFQAFPNMRFLSKPFIFNEFLDTVRKQARKPKPVDDEDIEGSDALEGEVELSEDEMVRQADMEKARMIQQSLLPKETPTLQGFDIGATYQACQEIGGDYFDFIKMKDGRLGFVVADVSGKAVSGAMVMVLARTHFRTFAPEGKSAKEVLLRVNKELTRDIRRGMFLTSYFGILDPAAGTISLCCSGHNPAVFWSEQFGFPAYLLPGGMAMGLIDGKVYEDSLREETIRLLPSDRILLYTDGVVEAMNEENEEFGEGKLAQVMAQAIRKTSQELNDAILVSVKEHQGKAETHDDITMLSIGFG